MPPGVPNWLLLLACLEVSSNLLTRTRIQIKWHELGCKSRLMKKAICQAL